MLLKLTTCILIIATCQLPCILTDDYCQRHKGAYIHNNGYNDVRVWIDPATPQDPSLIDSIKSILGKASEDLYGALNQRGYFQSVRIVIPSTWTINATFLDASPDDLNSDTSELHVALANPRYGDNPYTQKSVSQCGTEGDYVHLTPGFLKNPGKNMGNVITQNWAEQRYGVFPEFYDAPSNPNIANNYPFDTAVCLPYYDPKPTTCPVFAPGHQGKYKDNGKECHPCKHSGYTGSTPVNTPPPKCHTFYPKYAAGQDTSLMYTDTEQQVSQFCNDDNHNTAAVNLQNSKCQRQSVWSIIDKNVDFSPNCDAYGPMPNPPRNISNLKPSFTVVRNNDPKALAFVLDVSGSMSWDNPKRIQVLNQAVTGAIECMSVGEKVGLTQFSTAAQILLQLTVVSNGSRAAIENHVPTTPNGGTSIGAGILKGIADLRQGLGTATKGARLIIVSDGAENTAPMAYSKEVQDQIQSSGVVIDTLGISAAASGVLTQLANEYGGNAFFIDVGGPSWEIAMQTAVAQLCEITQPVDQRAAVSQVYSATTTTPTGNFTIDPFSGGETTFLFLSTIHKITVVLTGPNMTVKSGDARYYSIDGGKMVSIRLPTAAPGAWSYSILQGAFVPPPTYPGPVLPDVGPSMESPTQQTAPEISINQSINPNASPVAILVSSVAKNVELILAASTRYSYANITDVSKQQLIVSTTVQVGPYPVIDAHVTATIRPPSNCGVGRPKDITLVLLDNGKGADATANDGIYSSYFIDFSAVKKQRTTCRYSGSTSIIGQSDTKFISSSSGEVAPTGHFTRLVNNPLFNVDVTTIPTNSSIPPGRIEDFFSNGTDVVKLWISFRWTAPGDNYYSGTAAKYDLRYSTNVSELQPGNFSQAAQVNSSWIIGGSLVPKSAGSEQFVEIGHDFEEDITYYFGIVAVDEAGISGPVSNLAHVTFAAQPKSSSMVIASLSLILCSLVAALFAV